MNRFTSMFTLIAAYFLCIVLIASLQMVNSQMEDLEQLKLHNAIDRCTDAATNELLTAADLNMDYSDTGRLSVDPAEAVRTFVDVFLINYDLPLGDDNREMVRTQYIPILTVATYDGYYIFEPRKKTSDGSYDLVSTPKLPYIYKDAASTYALNFSLDKCLKLSDGKLTKVQMPISDENALNIINTRIGEDMMYRIDASYEGGFTRTMYFPTQLTKVSVENPIKGPTVIAFIDNLDINTSKRLSAFSVGGTEISAPQFLTGYSRGGALYYCWSELFPSAYTPLDTFTTMEDAAKAGYHYDTTIMK